MRRLLAAAVLATTIAGCTAGRPALRRSWVLGKPLDLGVSGLDGEPVAVGGADGTVRVVVVWASWCASCFQLFPALEVVAAGAEGRALAVVAISVDEDATKVREVLPRVPPHVRVLRDRGALQLGERLGIERLPTVLVLDRRGLVRAVHEGTDERLVEAIDGEVRQLLAE